MIPRASYKGHITSQPLTPVIKQRNMKNSRRSEPLKKEAIT